MIQLTRLNYVPLIINSDLIEHVEVTPDTVITLTTGQKFLVRESAEEVIDRVIQFRRAIIGDPGCTLNKEGALLQTEAGLRARSVAPHRE